MKRLTTILILTAAITGCSKLSLVSNNPFTLDVNHISSSGCWVEVIPESNDFLYYFTAVSMQEYYTYPFDEDLVNGIDRKIKAEYEEIRKDIGDISFEDLFLTTGAFYSKLSGLKPDTDYCVVAFPYDKSLTPVAKVSKKRFDTKEFVPSDISVSVEMNGSVFEVTPSNTDKYFWEYESVQLVEEKYGTPYIYYREIINMYTEFGFIDNYISVGPDSEDAAQFYDLKPGDEFYLISAGFDEEITSVEQVFKAIYNGPDKPGTIYELNGIPEGYNGYHARAVLNAFKPHKSKI